MFNRTEIILIRKLISFAEKPPDLFMKEEIDNWKATLDAAEAIYRSI